MSDFNKSAWSDNKFAKNYLDKADIYIVERRKMFWYFAIWRDWLGHMMDRYNVTDEAPEDLIKRYKDPSSMNKPDTLNNQLNALEEAGFLDVDCYFKNGIFAVFGGKR